MGATPMDRPEDVEAIIDSNWVGAGTVLVVCTNNRNEQPPRPGNPAREKAAGDDPAQGANLAGHVLKLEEAAHDCAATRFRWDVFALAGDPKCDLAGRTHAERRDRAHLGQASRTPDDHR